MSNLSFNATACGLLIVFGTAPAPTQDQLDQHQISKVRYWAERLESELGYLLEDVAYEAPPGYREIYDRADIVFKELSHLHRVVQREPRASHVYRDFAVLDKHLHELLRLTSAAADKSYPIQRSLNRVRQADRQLHYLLTRQEPKLRREAVARQVESLKDTAEDLDRAVTLATKFKDDGIPTRNALGHFVKETHTLHRNLERDASDRELRHLFDSVDKSWREVVTTMNQTWPHPHYAIRHTAARVNDIYANLHDLMDHQSKLPQLEIP